MKRDARKQVLKDLSWRWDIDHVGCWSACYGICALPQTVIASFSFPTLSPNEDIPLRKGYFNRSGWGIDLWLPQHPGEDERDRRVNMGQVAWERLKLAVVLMCGELAMVRDGFHEMDYSRHMICWLCHSLFLVWMEARKLLSNHSRS